MTKYQKAIALAYTLFAWIMIFEFRDDISVLTQWVCGFIIVYCVWTICTAPTKE